MVTAFRSTMLAALVGLIALGPSLGWSDDAAPERLVPGSFPGDLTTLTLDGATFAVRMEAAVGVGDAPIALVTVTNPGAEPLHVDDELHVYASESSPMSRVPVVMRKLLVNKALEVQLAAGEARVLRVDLGKALTTVDPKVLAAQGGLALMVGGPGPFPRYAVAVVRKGQQLQAQVIGGRMLVKSPAEPSQQAKRAQQPPTPVTPGAILARFAVDPAKLVRFTQRVERDAAGVATGLVVVAQNLTDLTLPNITVSVTGGEGHVALVEGAANRQLQGSGVQTATTLPSLKPHARHTFRFSLSKAPAGLELVTNIIGTFFNTEPIALAPVQPAQAAQAAQATQATQAAH